MQTKVSVIISVYNKEDHLSEMLDSVIAQTWDNIEVIIIDDGSTDRSGSIISAYIPKFEERGYDVRSIANENHGVCYSIGYGFSIASGEYCCAPDSDDELYPQYAEKLASYLDNNPDCMWVQCDNDRFAMIEDCSPGLKHNYDIELLPQSLDSYLLYRRHMGCPTIMTRKSCLIKHNVSKVMMECDCISQEIPFFGGISSYEGKYGYINEALYKYNKSTGTLSNPKNLADAFKIRYEGSERALKLYSKFDEHTEAVMWIGSLYKMSMSLQRVDQYLLFENELNEKLTNYATRWRLFSIADKDIVIFRNLDFGVNYRFVSNKVLNYRPKTLDIKRTGRIIAYSAYGKGLYGLKNALLTSNLRPDVFWDKAAKPNDRIDGISVEVPQFNTLTKNDTVLVLLKLKSHIIEVVNAIKNSQAKVYYYYDIMDYLVEYHFGGKDA